MWLPSPPCPGDTLAPLFGPRGPLWEVQGLCVFCFFFYKPRKCPGSSTLPRGGEGGGERGKKDFHLIVQQLENCCHLFCLSFAESGKKCGKIWGNKSQYPPRNSGPSLSVPCIPGALLPGLSPQLSGSWAAVGLGLGPGWACSGVVLGPGLV